MTIRTIRRNTKEAQNLRRTLTNARVYSLSNDFVGSDVEPRYAFEALDKFDFAKLTEREGIYCVRVHSNLWYELRGRPAPDYDPHIDHPERYTDGPI